MEKRNDKSLKRIGLIYGMRRSEMNMIFFTYSYRDMKTDYKTIDLASRLA